METTFEVRAGRDKDLADDMLKLVRYKILFVRREYEVAFPEQEDLVEDNMDSTSFAAWKVAEFIQRLHRDGADIPARWKDRKYPFEKDRNDKYRYLSEDGKRLIGLPESDKKFLRVYYEVLDRYPREKFKHEEQQIKVLEEIRTAIVEKRRDDRAPDEERSGTAGTAGTARKAEKVEKKDVEGVLPDPFEEMMHRLHISADTFNIWREGLARHAKTFGEQVAAVMNEHRAIGILSPPELTAQEVRDALASRIQPFQRISYDRFTGPALGELKIYRPIEGQPPEVLPAPPVHSIWGDVREPAGGNVIQRITGSNETYIDPDDVPLLWRMLSKEKVDLTFNAYTPELGMVSWASFYQNHANQLRSIGYEMNGKLLWINQLLDPDMTPTLGELRIPGVPGPPTIINKDQFVVSVDWEEKTEGKRFFHVYAMHIDFNFSKGTATFAGRILEMRNEVVKPS